MVGRMNIEKSAVIFIHNDHIERILNHSTDSRYGENARKRDSGSLFDADGPG